MMQQEPLQLVRSPRGCASVIDATMPEAEALNRQGLALAEQGRTAEAAELFRRAVESCPEHAAAHHNLGIALANLGRPEPGAQGAPEARLTQQAKASVERLAKRPRGKP